MSQVLAITFGHGAMLWAAGLALAPIIIHLLMRSRPRRVVFPALRFVRLTHNANVNRHRLKHLLLLLMRMSAIALAVVLLARPSVHTAGSGLTGRGPVSAVVVIDTSGSMLYRVAGQPRLQDARRLAVELLENLPPGSQAAVLWADRPGFEIELSNDISFCVQQIQELADRPDASAESLAPSMRIGQRVTMAPLLARAYASLSRAANERREIYVFNDATRDSWQDVGIGAYADQGNVSVYLIDMGVVGGAGSQDYVLTDARWPGQVLSLRQSPVLSLSARAGQLTETQIVYARSRDSTLGHAEISFSEQQSQSHAQIRGISLGGEGLHATRVFIDCMDSLPENNTRYLAVEVGPPPLVLMIESGSAGRRGWSVSTLVEATLAPPRARSLGTALVDLLSVQASQFLSPASEGEDRKRLADAHAVILADVRLLGEAQWAALENYVGGGGTLIVLLGPNSDPAALNWPAALRVLAAPGIARLVELNQPIPASYPRFDDNISQVLTVYRQNNRAPRIHREMVMRYYSLADRPMPPATVPLITLSDQARTPLLLERTLGTGRSLLLTTAGLGEWTQWSQGASSATLIYSMTMAYPRGLSRAHQFTMDQMAVVIVPREFRSGEATVTLPDGRGSTRLQVNMDTGAMALPTRHLGHYQVELRSQSGSRQQLLYAVNFDPDEFLFERLAGEELEPAFPPGRFAVLAADAQLSLGRARGAGGLSEIGPLIGIGLLLLLVGESFFANRFYRMPKAIPQPPG